MPLGQGWLNAWVKVNSKHVVFPPSKTEREHAHSSSGGGGGGKDTDSLATGKTQHTRGSGVSSLVGGGGDAAGSVATARTVLRNDVETQAIRRFNSRKQRRRLQRTTSASDLLREKSRGKGDKNDGLDPDIVLDRSSSSTQTAGAGSTTAASVSARKDKSRSSPPKSKQKEKQHHGAVPQHRLPQHLHQSEKSLETEGSLRFVAGFFGADIESLEAGASQSGHFQNLRLQSDAASVHRIGPKQQLDAASIASRGGHSLPARPTLSKNKRSVAPDSNESTGSRSSGMGMLFPPNLFAGDNTNSKPRSCQQCPALKSDLLSAQEDLEYLRAMIVRNEYVCMQCKSDSSRTTKGDDEDNKYSTVSDPRDRAEVLKVATTKHKSLVEQLNQNNSRWQYDAHAKLQKYAHLCKELNEEAELRSEEVLVLHKELEDARCERDEIASELEKARARISEYERNDVERQKAELTIQRYEERGLDGADTAIKTRDMIIADLTTRLGRALDCLELEREQQRQRRQIIFPSPRQGHTQNTSLSNSSSNSNLIGNNSNHNSSNSNSTTNTSTNTSFYVSTTKDDTIEMELKQTKNMLHETKASMEQLQHATKQKEMEWKLQMEYLQRQLDIARSN